MPDSTLPTPRYAPLWATLACLLAAMTLAYPALSGEFLVSPVSDQYIAGYAFRDFAAASLRAGEGFPLWNPYLFGGMPYVAAMHGDIFYPTFLLRLLLPTDVAMTWGMILHLVLCGVAGYAFLRSLALSFHASLIGGIAYMMSGQVASLVSPGHDGKLFVSALFPVTLLVITWGIRDGRRWAWGLLAIVTGLGVLSPHPQLLQYLLLGAGAWALMLAFGGEGTQAIARREALTRLGLALGAILLGFAMGAIQYLPVREYVDWSPRAGGRDYDYATSFSMPIEELINTWLPQFSGIIENYWGRNSIHLHSEYLGVGVLLLAVAAFSGARLSGRGRMIAFWTGVLVISLLWALGGNTPFYRLVYALVPGSKFFRAPSTIFYITTFAVSVLAAFGAERALAAKLSSKWIMTSVGIGATLCLMGVSGMLQAVAESVVIAPELLDKVEANADALRLGAVRSLGFLLAAGGLLWSVGQRRIGASAAGWALVALCTVDAWSVQRHYWKFSAPAAELYASDAIIEHLKREPQPVRVIGATLAEGAAYHDPFLDFDAMMSHGVRVTMGYHGNEIGRMQKLNGKDRRYDQIANPAFWGLLNVKYFYTNLDTLPIDGARRVVGPITNAAGSKVSLFELPGEHPYAWVVPTMAKYPDADVEAAVRAPNFPWRSVALLDTASATMAMPLTSLPEPLSITTSTTGYAPGRATIALSAPAPAGSALVVSENYYPGWTATVDGKPAGVERAMLSLMAIPLPAGARTVELRFDSPPYHTGKQITLIALALGVLLTGAGVVVERRSRDG